MYVAAAMNKSTSLQDDLQRTRVDTYITPLEVTLVGVSTVMCGDSVHDLANAFIRSLSAIDNMQNVYLLATKAPAFYSQYVKRYSHLLAEHQRIFMEQNPDIQQYFPGYMGSVDGCHFRIEYFGPDHQRYKCRHNYKSFNTMLVISCLRYGIYCDSGNFGSRNDAYLIAARGWRLYDMIPRDGNGKPLGYFLVDGGFRSVPEFLAPFDGIPYHPSANLNARQRSFEDARTTPPVHVLLGVQAYNRLLHQLTNAEREIIRMKAASAAVTPESVSDMLKQIEIQIPRDTKKKFNRLHARVRVLSENYNGILKGRFQIFQAAMEYKLTKSASIIYSCVAVNNLILEVESQLRDIERDSWAEIYTGDGNDGSDDSDDDEEQVRSKNKLRYSDVEAQIDPTLVVPSLPRAPPTPSNGRRVYTPGEQRRFAKVDAEFMRLKLVLERF